MKKVNKYNLSDGEEDESEHYKGKLLSDVDDFQEDVPIDDDEADHIQSMFCFFFLILVHPISFLSGIALLPLGYGG